MKSPAPAAHAIILAGGRGTRFWPRSRSRSPKQLLNIVGQKTMLEQTFERLSPLFSTSRIWAVTNHEQADAVRRQLWQVPSQHVLIEPVGRNTTAAIALAAAHLLREESSGDALMAILPADHFIAKPARYRQIVRAALRIAAQPDALVVLGIPPTRPETGYGYIERAARQPRAVLRIFQGCRLSRSPLYGKAFPRAGPQICRFPTLSLERRHVLLAPLHIRRNSSASSAQDARRHDSSCRKRRNLEILCRVCSANTRASKIFLSTTRFSNQPRAIPSTAASLSFPPRSAGATSALGLLSMSFWPGVRAQTSPAAASWPSTRRET